ncbi:bifunctional DNA-formamidopyrimidine glycosylase/DNA-(apurinic or apyrimidinic site) lyase [Sporosarcina sp. CAU 1771]
MPELPEVEGLVRQLAPVSIGRTIRQAIISDIVIESKAQGKEAIVKGMSVDRFTQDLIGMSIKNVTRRSKYIYIDLKKEGQTYLLVSHLGMSGAWFAVNSLDEVVELKFRKHIHVILEMEDGGMLVYSDIRRFGELRFLTREADHPPLLKMAPEPFDETACAHFLEFAAKPKYARKAIKEVIMDGHVISGCGNIYATEALYRMNIHPGRKAERISEKRKIELFEVIVNVLQESIDAGGSTISDYRTINGESGNMQNHLQMYGRKKCPSCQVETKSMKIAGRTSVYCPSCQR